MYDFNFDFTIFFASSKNRNLKKKKKKPLRSLTFSYLLFRVKFDYKHGTEFDIIAVIEFQEKRDKHDDKKKKKKTIERNDWNVRF